MRIRNNVHDAKEYVATGYNNHKMLFLRQTQHCLRNLTEKKHIVTHFLHYSVVSTSFITLLYLNLFYVKSPNFPSGTSGKEPAANAGDIRDVDEEGVATHSHLKNPMDGGGW